MNLVGLPCAAPDASNVVSPERRCRRLTRIAAAGDEVARLYLGPELFSGSADARQTRMKVPVARSSSSLHSTVINPSFIRFRPSGSYSNQRGRQRTDKSSAIASVHVRRWPSTLWQFVGLCAR
ncbi:hypothetical protein EVAR_11279_1 [Eumeta japonica]|uniref:Uncharacterized protein n=1 Tax=Eumeta variegata TaxID=151549 RepID=A0A4C1UKP5_EUMVA|nr:hypothetical protein EVAR_11279_1 [Eumeta japonica]